MVRLKNISKYYGNIKAIDSVSFGLNKGEVLGLVGPNGSGKTTLLKIILGILKPSSGNVHIEGKELSEKDWRLFRKRIGYMPERITFYDNLSGIETLQFFSKVKGGNIDNIHTILSRLLSDDDIHRRVGGYSKGMRQRLNLAQSLLNDPDLLILDEPTSGLDPVGTREFYDILDGVRARKELTVILSSHILAEIEDKIDRIAVMANGELKAIGSLEKLYTSLNLPIRISVALINRLDSLEDLLRREGVQDIAYKNGYLTANVQPEDKLKIISMLMEKKNSFMDISIREPNLEEVFFGVH